MRITKTKVIIFCSVALSVLIALSAIFVIKYTKKQRIATRKPILKVVSVAKGMFALPSKDIYYIVYDNGDYEKTQPFHLKEIEEYPLYDFDETKMQDDKIVKYVEIIINYANKIPNSLLNNLYVVDDKYFFDVHDERSQGYKYQSTIYEYFPNDNTIEKVVEFKNYSTKYVELY